MYEINKKMHLYTRLTVTNANDDVIEENIQLYLARYHTVSDRLR